MISSLLQEARDTQTTPERLSELASLDADSLPPGVEDLVSWQAARTTLLGLVAANPNIDQSTLLHLLPTYPEETLRNPAFELQLLMEPNFIRDLWEAIRIAVACCTAAPEVAIRSLLDDPSESVQYGLAGSPYTPPERLRDFAVAASSAVRSAVAKNPRLDAKWLELLVRAGSDPSLDAWAEEAGPLTEEELAILLSAGAWSRSLVARHPQTPIAWFQPQRLSGSNHQSVGLREKAQESAVPPERENAEPDEVRCAMASNPRLPEALLVILAADSVEDVLQEVARNPAASEPVQLALLRADSTPEYTGYMSVNPARNLSASHPDLRQRTFESLCGPEAPAPFALENLARNPVASPLALRLLSTCGLDGPARLAREHPRMEPAWRDLLRRSGLDRPSGQRKMDDLADRPPEQRERAELSGRPDEQMRINELSVEDLTALAEAGVAAQQLAAAHPATPLPWLRFFAREKKAVHLAMATNPALDDELKRMLADSADHAVQLALARAHPLPPEARERLMADGIKRKDLPLLFALLDRGDLPLAYCLNLAALSGVAARVLLTHHALPGLLEAFESEGPLLDVLLESPVAPPAVLAAHAQSADWTRRQAIGINPVTPRETLETLAQDGDFRVRTAVATNPACPEGLLALLARDPSPRIQQIVQARREQKQAIAAKPNEEGDSC